MRRVYEKEKTHPWLSILLDAYNIKDKGIKKELRIAQEIKGKRVACHKGCSACCKNPSISISELEFKGIVWFVVEELDIETQDLIIENINKIDDSTACPFLVNDQCGVYQARPLTCRMFYVFNTVCKEEEHVEETRPYDIHRTTRELAREVSIKMLDYEGYGLTSKFEKEAAFENGIMMESLRQLHEIDLGFLKSAILSYREKRGHGNQH
jgi:uncharacterized protein